MYGMKFEGFLSPKRLGFSWASLEEVKSHDIYALRLRNRNTPRGMFPKDALGTQTNGTDKHATFAFVLPLQIKAT